MCAETPTCAGPKIELVSPVEIRLAAVRPLTSRMLAPRSRPASADGLAAYTSATRISEAETISDLKPKPTYWLSLVSASLAARPVMKLKVLSTAL